MSLTYEKPYHATRCFGPMRFFNLVTGNEKRTSSGSLSNRTEARLVVNIYKTLHRLYGDYIRPGSIGIITPYSAQREEVIVYYISSTMFLSYSSLCIHVQLSNAFANDPEVGGIDFIEQQVDINTVDGFQGREKDIIILSCVRANQRDTIGFLKDVRRMNVALTRAKYAVWVVGNASSLRVSAPWAAFIDFATSRNAVIYCRDDNVMLECL